MKSLPFLKYVFYGVIGLALLYNCGGSSEVEYEEVAIPTEGLITIVQEVQKDEFKIAEEITIPDTSNSLIIAHYLDTTSDTFTLAEVRLMEANGYPGREGSIMQSAAYGFFGYMIARNLLGGGRPSAGAYVNQSAYDKTSKNAGASLNNTAARTRTAKPTSGKSGFGGGSKSTRSVGG